MCRRLSIWRKRCWPKGRKIHGNKAKVNVGVSTFVPKPHTPFQWVSVDTMEQIRAKQDLLKQRHARARA